MSETSGTGGAKTEGVVRRFEALPELVAAVGDLTRRGRFLTCDFMLGIGDVDLVVSIDRGRVAQVTRGPFLLRPWVFSLSASAEVWDRFLEPMPAAGMHDVMALSKRGLLKIEGNLQPLMANLQFVKDVIAAPRATGRRS